MLASIAPLFVTFFGAVASAALGLRAREEMIKVAAIGTAVFCTLLSLMFAPLVLKVVVLVPSLAMMFVGSGEGG